MEELLSSCKSIFASRGSGDEYYSSSAQKHCPSCNFENKPKAPFCRACGWTLPFAIENGHALLDDRVTCFHRSSKSQNRSLSSSSRNDAGTKKQMMKKVNKDFGNSDNTFSSSGSNGSFPRMI